MNAAQFDATVNEWLAYQRTPRGRIRSALLERGVMRHAPAAPCNVLDIGGGLGELSARLSAAGHRVTLADFSSAMLDAARGRFGATLTYASLDLAEPGPLPGAPFDMIVCHNVLEYVPDTSAAIQRLAAGLRPNGVLSLAFGNARHAPLQSALLRRDFERARREIETGAAESTNVFGTQTHVLSIDRVRAQLTAAGLRIDAGYGIRCVTDLLVDADNAAFDALLALETDMMLQPAYLPMARFVQLIARLPDAGLGQGAVRGLA